jgi:hypothetical protein
MARGARKKIARNWILILRADLHESAVRSFLNREVRKEHEVLDTDL